MAETGNCNHVALYADEIDEGVVKAMELEADALRNLSRREVELRGFDKQKNQRLSRKLVFSINLPGLDVTRVAPITKLGKKNSLVFAADVIADSLLHRLQQHPIGTSLNIKKSVEGWPLADRVFAPEEEEHDIYSRI